MYNMYTSMIHTHTHLLTSGSRPEGTRFPRSCEANRRLPEAVLWTERVQTPELLSDGGALRWKLREIAALLWRPRLS